MKQIIPLDWLERIKTEIEGIHERMAREKIQGTHVSWEKQTSPDRPKRIMQLMGSQIVSPTLDRILHSENTLDIVEDLIGPNISLFHSKLLLKAAGDGAAVPWHQDYAYWQTQDNRPLQINCQMAIDAATLENGCIQFVPGSHRWGLQEHEREQVAFGVYLKGHWQERKDAVPVETMAGDAVFFNCLVIHGSAPNSSTQDRRMNTIAFNVTGNGRGKDLAVLRGAPPTG